MMDYDQIYREVPNLALATSELIKQLRGELLSKEEIVSLSWEVLEESQRRLDEERGALPTIMRFVVMNVLGRRRETKYTVRLPISALKRGTVVNVTSSNTESGKDMDFEAPDSRGRMHEEYSWMFELIEDVLKERYAIAIHLYYIMEMSIYDISRIYGVSPQRVDQIVKRGIEKIRAKLKK